VITGIANTPIAMTVLLPGREVDQVVAVSVENLSRQVVFSGTLAHVANGRYEAAEWIPVIPGHYYAYFRIYATDGVTPSSVYGDFMDDVQIEQQIIPWAGSITIPRLATIARIRALAGFRARRVLNESIGTGDGTRLSFSPYTETVFVSPTNDEPTFDEITIRVDGLVVPAAAISENYVTLATAPALGTIITADYWGHNLPSSDVDVVRRQVEAEVFGKLNGMYSYDNLSTSPVISKIVGYMAAAMLSDEAYNETGANTPGTMFPPDRLRRIASNLLNEVTEGTITLVDAEFAVIPVVSTIERWLLETNYGERDRLFETDPFDADDGILVHQVESDWRWNS
jgi:hypothetical protein